VSSLVRVTAAVSAPSMRGIVSHSYNLHAKRPPRKRLRSSGVMWTDSLGNHPT